MTSLMIVKPERLKAAPQCFQNYVRAFFVEKVLFGETYLVAQRCTVPPSRAGMMPWHNGVAPAHTTDLARFPGLSDWIYGLGPNSGIYEEVLLVTDTNNYYDAE